MRRWLGVFAMIVLIAASIPALAEEKPLYPIRENGLWGYMNRQGETVIPAQWGQTWPFDGDTALVSTFQHDMYMDIFGDGLIDRNGNYLIEPREHVLIENDRYAYRICDENEPDCEGFYDKASGFYLPPQPQYKYVMLWGFRYTGDSDDVCFRNGYARPADEIIVVDAVGHELAMGTQMHLIDGLGRELTFENGISPISTVFNGRFIYSATNPVSEETEDQEPDDGDAYLGNGEKIIPPYNSIDALTGEKTEMPDWYTSSNEDSFAGLGIADHIDVFDVGQTKRIAFDAPLYLQTERLFRKTFDVGLSAFLAALRYKFAFVPVIDQRVDIFVNDKNNVSAASSVTTVRTAIRNIFFPAEGNMSVSAFS